MSRLGIYAFADEAGMALESQIAAMKRNGLDGIEIRNVNGMNVSDLTALQAREIGAQLKEAGLRVWSIGSPIGKIDIVKDDFNVHMDKFRNTLEVAQILEAENIRLFSFFMPADCDPAVYRDEVFRRMGAMLEAAQGSGVDICHENEKGIYGDMAVRCLDLHKNFPALKGIFDPANFIQCGQDTWEAWQMLKPYVKYLHIKDALADGNVVPAGKGIGQVPRILGEYLDMGGMGVTLEPHLKVFDGLNALEREGERSGIGAFCYDSNDSAFDAACNALKEILEER